ncbi:hypothetical protein LTR36_000031 [Oleoguttula mirabilis]|uniref:Transcription initiation factor TFIID subunit 4 n=1 Tax=Oleoguttula mirabilis TaxID=1507867 RepID=A0AAV9JXF2_9PEZI|nr:hypothetical protein LTR36_000031 [Oleoguttula mirabilis]
MSYNPSMSPPQKPAPRPYSPAAYQNAGSPTNSQGFAQPPAKRQRMSPDARPPAQQYGMPPYAAQPQGTPTMGTPGAYGNPYAPQQSPYGSPSTFAGSPQSSFNTPQVHQQNQQQWFAQPPPPPPPAAANRQMSPQGSQSQSQSQHMQNSQMMPPPPRPNKDEKDDRMSVDDISDPMYGSGINLRDEENYMHSFQTNQSTSFGSSTMSPNNSFSQLRQSFNPDSQRGPGGALEGTLGDLQTQNDIEAEVRRKRERAAAARERAEKKQYPMEKDTQFLQTNSLRRRMDQRCRENGVNMDVRGLYQRLPQPEPQHPQHPYRTNVMMNGVASEGIVSVDSRPEYTAGRGEQFEQVLSLLCLAAGDRLRGLMDEAFALSRARRFGDHGRVPPDFADIAVGAGEQIEEMVRPENVTGSQWDRLPDAASSPTAANGGDLPNGTAETATPQPLPTISFSNAITARLREVALRDKVAEEARIKKREARRKRAAETATPTSDAAGGDTAAADEATAPKISKKELERQKKEASKHAEANLHSTTNQTAALMALKGKKKYSWMTGGVANLPTNRFAKPTPANSGTATPNGAMVSGANGADAMMAGGRGDGAAAAVGSPGGGGGGQAMAPGLGQQQQQQEVKVPEWGDWREDSPAGRGVQARDWVIVLDRDGKEKRALQRVLNRLA